MIHYTTFKSPLGDTLVAKSSKGICKISFAKENRESNFDWLTKHFPEEEIVADSITLSPVVNELNRYFRGEIRKFTFPLDLKTTSFRKKVLEEVSKIPYGKTASYKQIAERMGRPEAIRAVGGANANNPLPIAIPCHRVIAHDGSLGGFGGRLDLKALLLELEGAL